jgi:hypothetical protein
MSFFSSADDDGSIVILSGNKPLWSSRDSHEPTKTKTVKSTTKVRASAKNKRIVEFQIFDDLMKYETDPTWITTLDDAAQGKFPRNFKFQNSILTYKLRSKNIDHPIVGNDKAALDAMKDFFFKYNVASPEDVKKRKEAELTMINSEQYDEEMSWSQIRSDKEKTVMITLFVESLGEIYNLSPESKRGLVQNIRIGILAGYLNNDNIHIESNSITKIDGLVYDKSLKQFIIDKNKCILQIIKPKIMSQTSLFNSNQNNYSDDTNDFSLEESTYSKSGKSHKQDLMKNWNKFLGELDKKK